MNDLEVLSKLGDNEVSVFEAYTMLEHQRLVPDKPKKARFVKLHIKLREENKATRMLLGTLFALPLPLGLIRFFLVNAFYRELSKNKEWAIDKETLTNMLKYAKDTSISIESNDANIHIKLY